MLRKRDTSGTSSALVARSANDMEAMTGMDEEEIRDSVMTLSAIEPKKYQQFRNKAKYGTTDGGNNIEIGDFKVHKDKSIKTMLSNAYGKTVWALKLVSTAPAGAGDQNEASYDASTLRAFLLPYDIIMKLPHSVKQQMVNEAYEQAKNTSMASFDTYFPASFQKQAVDTNSGMAIKGL